MGELYFDEKLGYFTVDDEDTYYFECVNSGFCCKNNPCFYGEPVSDTGACKHLETKFDGTAGTTVTQCGIYDYIINQDDHQSHVAFGLGCCSPFDNPLREAIVKKIKPTRI